MKKRFIISILMFLITLVIIGLLSPDVVMRKYKITNKESEAFFQTFREKLFALCLPDIDLKSITFDNFRVISQSRYPIWGKNFVILTLADNKFLMAVNPKNRKILSCSNQYISEKSKNIETINLKPERTKDDIIHEAEKYLIILNGEIPKNAYLSYAKYKIPEKYDNENSKEGFWVVRWVKNRNSLIDNNSKHMIEIEINEKHGLKHYLNNF